MFYLLTSTVAAQRSTFLRISNLTKDTSSSLFLASSIYLQILLIMKYKKSSQKEHTTAFSSSLENLELRIVLCSLVELPSKA